MTTNKNYTQHISGQGQGNQGDGNTNNNIHNYGSGEVDVDAFFKKLLELTTELGDDQENFVKEVVEPLAELAKQPEAATTENEIAPAAAAGPSTFQKCIDKLKPHAWLIVRCVSAFGEASLSALMSKNPIIAGIIAVAGEIRR